MNHEHARLIAAIVATSGHGPVLILTSEREAITGTGDARISAADAIEAIQLTPIKIEEPRDLPLSVMLRDIDNGHPRSIRETRRSRRGKP
jgi:hypothetical protein